MCAVIHSFSVSAGPDIPMVTVPSLMLSQFNEELQVVCSVQRTAVDEVGRGGHLETTFILYSQEIVSNIKVLQ